MATKKERGALAPEELVAGERAVVELEAVLSRVDEDARTPRQEQVSVVREVLSRQGSLLGQLGAIRAGVLDAGHVAGLVTRVERVPTVCRALLYVETRVLALRSAERVKDEDEVRLEALRARGLELVRLLVASGHVSEGTLKQITRGSGKVDHARDAVRLGELLKERWEVAEALQGLQAGGASLSVADRDALHTLGLAALEAMKGATGEGTLEVQERRYAALSALLKADWDGAVRAVRYAAESDVFDGEPEPSLTQLRRG